MNYFQKQLSENLNTLTEEKFFKNLQKTSQVNNFLLNYYFKDVIIDEVNIKYDEHDTPIVKREGQINPEKEHYVRNSDEKLKDEKTYTEHLQLIEDELGIKTKNAFDIDVRGSRKSANYYYYIKHAKNNPLRLSVHEKRIEVCKIKASTLIDITIKEILQMEDKDMIVDLYKQLMFFSDRFQEESEKCKSKKFKAYMTVFQDTLSKATRKIQQEYPFSLMNSENEYITSNGLAPVAKLVWNSDPDLFFMLFSVLIEENILKISGKKQNLHEFAAILHENFEVKTKIGGKNPYKLKSFFQNLKPSGEFQEKSAHYIELKSRLKDIFKEYL